MPPIFHVVLTGGVGSRLWPLSRQSRPKQYLEIFAEQSLFDLTVKRNAPFSDGLVVVGNQSNRTLSEKSLQKQGIISYVDIVEATPRNTAPAITFAALAAKPQDILLVTPADHIIKEGPDYSTAVQKAIDLAKKNNIVTFGIRPTRPETGYGYIEFEGDEVLSFREKPNAATAKGFIEQGNFLWNSGMFCFKAGVFLDELRTHSPAVFLRSMDAFEAAENNHLGLSESMEIPSISVDYAVMEKSDRIKVIKSDFEWSYMGSFEAVYDYLKEQGQPVDAYGNMQIGSSKHTSFVGLKNCIFVSTDDACLVLSKAAAEHVRELYHDLESSNLELL